MDVKDRMPVFRFHLDKGLVAQDSGIVDQNVQRTEGVQGGFNDILTTFDGCHIVVIGHGLAAGRSDFGHDLIGR